tara:strand:+ start:573 stop:839 length:267 start_codon:yes stop_codon:yes gene_type:complete
MHCRRLKECMMEALLHSCALEGFEGVECFAQALEPSPAFGGLARGGLVVHDIHERLQLAFLEGFFDLRIVGDAEAFKDFAVGNDGAHG